MIKKSRILIIFSSLYLLIGWLDPYADEVSKGNKKYADKKYSDAVENYKRADNHAPGDDDKKRLSFNKGAALQQSGETDRAAAEYKKALELGDPDLQKRALFNLGNMHLKAGRDKEAFDSYMSALKIDPNYEKAKKNIEYMLKKKQKGDDNPNDKDKSGDDKNSRQQNQNKNESRQDAKNKQEPSPSSTKKKMSPEEAKAALESMKKNAVRRQKGSGKDARYLEKFW